MEAETLRRLVKEHDAPLVLKSDNGSGFVAEGSAELCRQHGMLALLSPPRTRVYNGAGETSNAWIKRDLADLAPRSDAPLTDLLQEIAERRSRTGRPWGAQGPTPDERWGARSALSARLRRRLGPVPGLCQVAPASRPGRV